MRVVDIDAAKGDLLALVERAAAGEPFVISRGGQPLVKVVAMEDGARTVARRIGFMAGQITVSEDFDRMGDAEIHALFGKSTS